MCRFRSLQSICFVLGLLCTSSLFAQEPTRFETRVKGSEFHGWESWNADRWIQVLIDLTIDTDANAILDRLARFHLTASQVKQLTAAADRELSNSKRVILWQAIRMSQDHRGRDYLIEILVEKSSVEMQIQFIEQLRTPTRFDVPILAALYNSHRPQKKAEAERDKESNAPGEDGDVFNVPLKIVEYVCLTQWRHSVIDRTLTPFREKDYDSEAMNQKRLIRSSKISQEAELAQHAMVHWLIRNGFEDSHRISAYERFVHVPDFRGKTTIAHDYGLELLRGLDNPESKAKVIPLVGASIDPSRYLVDDEAEVVRLSAIKAIEKAVIESRKAQSHEIFQITRLRYKPILEMVQNSDASPDVRRAAKLVHATIVEYEKLDTKEARGELK